jgi:hypothetical protein
MSKAMIEKTGLPFMGLIGDVANGKKRNELGRISEDTAQSLLPVRLRSRALPPFRPPELIALDAASVLFACRAYRAYHATRSKQAHYHARQLTTAC